MYSQDVDATRCEALFASALQSSDRPTKAEIRNAIAKAVRELGSGGCACRMAQEFGDHPEAAVARMKWARDRVAEIAEASAAAA